MITHVVLLGLTDAADCPEALDRLRALPARIPELLTLRCGQALPESGGFASAASTGGGVASAASTGGGTNLVLITEHTNEAGLDAYQDHPVHQAFLDWIGPRISTRAAVDTDDLR
ncbi:MAG: Dabb family protein [Candidatus Nanopelagicales bacterium]